MAASDLTAARLRELLHYDPETGLFTRTVSRNSRHHVGEVAGYTMPCGHIRISLDRKGYMAHRLAWLYMTGEWPAGEIDHINGVPNNNRFSNLRDAGATINRQNLRRARVSNGTGLLGVHARSNGRYRARIYADGRLRYLGTFDTPEEAHVAYVMAKRQLHRGCTL